jgi:hypothetical protein
VANPNPFVDPYIFGTAFVGSMVMPGVIESIDGCETPERWFVQMGLTVSGSVTVWRGTKIAEGFTIMNRVYDKDTFDQIYTFKRMMQPKRGTKPSVVQIINGTVNFLDVYRISLINFIPPKSAPGLSWTWGMKVLEYRPPHIAPVGPPDPPKAPSANDAKQAAFAALLKQASEASQS